MHHGDDALSIKHECRPRGCIALRRQPSGNSGILIGGISVPAIREPYFRDKLRRRRRSRLPMLLALGLAVAVGQNGMAGMSNTFSS